MIVSVKNKVTDFFKWQLCCLIAVLLLLCYSTHIESREVLQANGSLILSERHGGDGSAWGKSECEACHFMGGLHQTVPKIKTIVNQVGFSSCTGCHGQNGTQKARPCLLCHNREKLPSSPIQSGPETHDFKVDASWPLADQDCQTCHQSSDMDGVFEADVDLSDFKKSRGLDLPYQNTAEFCLRCHNQNDQQTGFEMNARFDKDPLITMDDNFNHIDVHGRIKGTGKRTYAGLRPNYRYGTVVPCTDCHAMHGTHNAKLIINRIDSGATSLNDALREQALPIDIREGDYSQLCVTCHAMTNLIEDGSRDTGNGLSGVHQVGSDCSACHAHGLAVQTGL